jgi:hypothetical protein
MGMYNISFETKKDIAAMIKVRSGMDIIGKAAPKSNIDWGNKSSTKGCNKYIPKVVAATFFAISGKTTLAFARFLVNTNIDVATINEGREKGVFIIYEGSLLYILLPTPK